jgi:predicted PurR-regulated permease PerM
MSAPSRNQSRILWAALTVLAITIGLACLIGLVWGLGRVLDVLSPVIWPLAVAGALAYLLDPVVDLLEKRKMKRQWAIICVFAVAILVIGGISALVVPRLVSETRDLVVKIPDYTRQLQQRAVDWLETKPNWKIPFLSRPTVTEAPTNATLTLTNVITITGTNVTTNTVAGNTAPVAQTVEQQTVQSIAAWLPKVLPIAGQWLVNQVSRVAAWFGLLAGIALVPVYCFYFLLEKKGIQGHWTNYLPVSESRVKEEIVFVITAINDRLIVFFRGQVLVAACDGLLYAIGFFAMGLNYALLLGLVAAVLTIVPFLGAIVTFVIAFVLAVVQFQDWLHQLLVVGVFAVVQTLEGLVISPKIIGDRVGLHPLTIIVSVMVGTTLLGGLLGGLLAIPLTATLRVLMFRYVWKKAEK